MTDMTDDKVKALLDGATPGRRVQFHGSYCPEAVGTPFTDWDTSHDMSVIRPDGSRYRLAHYKHASDAYLSQMAPDLARALLDARADAQAAVADIVRSVWGRCEALEDEAADKLAQLEKLTDHEKGFWRGQKTVAKSIRRSTEMPTAEAIAIRRAEGGKA